MQDKITIADAPDCLNTNDKAMWVLGYQAALAARSTCLHQIQEPAPAQAAPAVAEKPDEAQIKALMRKHRIWIEHSTLFEDDEPPRELRAVQAEQHQFESFVRELIALAATPAADAPVGPDDAEIIAALEAAGVAFLKFFGGRDGKTLVHTTSGYQKASSLIAGCRALLAAAAGLPAQAVPAFCHVASLKLKSLQERGYQITGYALEKPVEGAQPERGFINHGGFVGWWWDGQSPQAQADAQDAQLLAFAVSEIRRDEMTDSALLDAMEQNRIAVVPEYEGPWDAEIYNDEGKPNHRGSGSTPREAIRAAIAAQAAQGGE